MVGGAHPAISIVFNRLALKSGRQIKYFRLNSHRSTSVPTASRAWREILANRKLSGVSSPEVGVGDARLLVSSIKDYARLEHSNDKPPNN
jgi:hypothetical protein